MKKGQKYLTALLTLTMVMMLAACGNSKKATSHKVKKTEKTSQTEKQKTTKASDDTGNVEVESGDSKVSVGEDGDVKAKAGDSSAQVDEDGVKASDGQSSVKVNPDGSVQVNP